MAVRGTTNYVYFTDQSLGTGASGNVYFGRHKRRGDPCAIKVFRSSDGAQLQMRQREFNVMSKLNHENIVKFIAIEPESHGDDRVLIMELCTGGSVYRLLEEPENAFGFAEDEFLVFLHDITKALQYLRQKRLIHRDIKPGNILRYIKDDLGSIYKLTDFGAARELPEGGEFMSLYGTEEYLHPDVYARALLERNRYDIYPKTFNASVDLWSLGVTIYHVATGRLPFQPFGGRKNKEAMHMIISRKKSGCISGVQRVKDGTIEWSEELPKTCGLSWGLKRLLVPVLVGLLESNKQHQMNFDDFFLASKDITSRSVIHVFYVANSSQDRLYLGNEEKRSLTHFKEFLAEMSKLPDGRQLYFHERWSVDSSFPSADDVGSKVMHKRTSAESPLYVMPTTFVSTEWTLETCDLPMLPASPANHDISEDVTFSRSTCAYVMYLSEKTRRLSLAQNSFAICAGYLKNLLFKKVQELQLFHQFSIRLYEKLSKIRSSGVSIFKRIEQQWDQIKAKFEKIENHLNKLGQDFNSCSLTAGEFLKAFCAKMCPPSVCTMKQEHLVKELEGIKNIFREHKKREKDLSYNEQQIHKFDRGRAADGAKRSQDLYCKHCSVNTEATWTIFQSYHSYYSKQRKEIEQSENLLREVHDQMAEIDDYLICTLLQERTEKSQNARAVESMQTAVTDKINLPVNIASSDDSAFVNDLLTTSFLTGSVGPCMESYLKDEELRHRGIRVCAERIPEGINTDSGIELLSSSIRETLRDSYECLKDTLSTSNDTEQYIEKIRSEFLMMPNS